MKCENCLEKIWRAQYGSGSYNKKENLEQFYKEFEKNS